MPIILRGQILHASTISPINWAKSYCPKSLSSKYMLMSMSDLERMFVPTLGDSPPAGGVGTTPAPPHPRNELLASILIIRPSVFPLRMTSQTAHSSSDARFDRESMTRKSGRNRAFRMGALPRERRFFDQE